MDEEEDIRTSPAVLWPYVVGAWAGLGLIGAGPLLSLSGLLPLGAVAVACGSSISFWTYIYHLDPPGSYRASGPVVGVLVRAPLIAASAIAVSFVIVVGLL